MTVQEKISAAQPKSAIPDDMAMLRAAVELTRDISAARPGIYWPDMLVSAAAGYAGIAGAILLQGWTAWVAGAIASTCPGILLSRFATADGVAMAAMGTLAIAACWQRTLHGRSRQWLIVAGLMSGTAIAVNGSACLLLIPLGAWWAWMFWQRPEQRPTLWQACGRQSSLWP